MILAPASPDYCAAIIRGMWPVVSDDASGEPEDFEPIDHPDAYYLVPIRDGDMGGVIALFRQSSAVVEIHASLLPGFRGAAAAAVLGAVRAYLAQTIPEATRLRAWVPACNRAALAGVRRLGFTECGKEPQAFRKDGALYDLHLFGVDL